MPPLAGHARTLALMIVAGAATVVGLLNGACGTSPANGHCWRPGTCREVPDASYCTSRESFAEDNCETTLMVGTCVSATGENRIHLYAPLHGLLAPNCEEYTGPGSRYVQ